MKQRGCEKERGGKGVLVWADLVCVTDDRCWIGDDEEAQWRGKSRWQRMAGLVERWMPPSHYTVPAQRSIKRRAVISSYLLLLPFCPERFRRPLLWYSTSHLSCRSAHICTAIRKGCWMSSWICALHTGMPCVLRRCADPTLVQPKRGAKGWRKAAGCFPH